MRGSLLNVPSPNELAQIPLPCFMLISQHLPPSDKHQFYLSITPLLLEPGTWVSRSLLGLLHLAGSAHSGRSTGIH